jgi:large subunit ribosomal protein L9
MQVILLERVSRLGAIGDVVNVRDGYARNFLLPRQKALRATKENMAQFEARKAEIERQNAEARAAAQKQAADLDSTSVIILRQAGEDGRLFGSVTARDIATALVSKDASITHHMIVINTPVKYVGVYQIPVTLHPEVVVKVKLAVARTESEAREALAGRNVTAKNFDAEPEQLPASLEAEAAPEGDQEAA